MTTSGAATPSSQDTHATASPFAPVNDALDAVASQLAGAATVFVGFSGGLDSSVLLHALAQRTSLSICALHVDHGLQPESPNWATHCRDTGSQLGVEVRVQRLQVENTGKGVEAAARDARHQWFESCLGDDDVLLLAHHQDDQVETLLLRLLRGAGPDGLAAMRPARPIGRGHLLRPLLAVSRAALRDYATAAQLHWIDDPSNSDPRFDRNYLRLELLPRIESRWPGYRKTLSRAADQLRDVADSVTASEMPVVLSCIGDPGFALDALPDEPLHAARALRAWLKQRHLNMPSAAMLEEFLRQVAAGGHARLATREWVLERFRSRVFAYSPFVPAEEGAWSLAEGESRCIPGIGSVSLVCATALDREDRDVYVRLRRGGDRLLREAGHHSDLKKVFQELAVPPWWRDRIPLLMRRTPQGEEVLAVGSLLRSSVAIDAGLELHWRPELLAVNA